MLLVKVAIQSIPSRARQGAIPPAEVPVIAGVRQAAEQGTAKYPGKNFLAITGAEPLKNHHATLARGRHREPL